MTTSTFNMRMDLAPYLPDSYLKDRIYQSYDKVDYTTYISINKTIFIFNIKCNNDTEFKYYNDPGYLLYGFTQNLPNSTQVYPYMLPSTYFFNAVRSVQNLQQRLPYIILNSSTVITIPIRTLIGEMGYNVDLIDEKYFYYAEIECTDACINYLERKVITYLFFTQKDLNSINYNNYYTTVYYLEKYNNVLIYPYVNIPTIKINGLNRNLALIFTLSDTRTLSNNIIEPIDFDDREITKYYQKIDYKYLEREDYYIDTKNKLEVLRYLGKNLSNYEDYFNQSQKTGDLMISNNEISKVYYNNLDYEHDYRQSYTLTKLNNRYLNSNKTYSGKDKKYSFTLDNKISYVEKNIKDTGFKYVPYNYSVINIPSIYQMSKNYYLNTYVDILKWDPSDSKNLLYVANCFLYKILLMINPLIIDSAYLVNQSVKLIINNIFPDNNNLKFGFGLDKITLFFRGEPRVTNTYYINKYKINFQFNLSEFEVANYVIILGVCFYNGQNINLLSYDTTRKTDDLGYVLYTNEDLTVSLNPSIYNLNKQVKIYEQKEVFLYDLKKYTFSLNFLDKNMLDDNSNFDDFQLVNFYSLLTNFNTDKLNNKKTYVSNNLNLTVNKVNNFIKNLININTNIYVFKQNNFKSKTLMTYDLLYDLNLENVNINLIYNLTYYPNVLQYRYLPLNINKYKVYTRFPENIQNLVTLPAGFYKVIKYTNFFPKYDFLESNTDNDKLVLTINTINSFQENNFCLLIRIPNNAYVENKFYVDLQSNNKQTYYSQSNYLTNMNNQEVELYLVVANSNGQIYYTTNNIVYAYKLFDSYNSLNNVGTNTSDYKIKILGYVSSYMNLYQIVLNLILFNDYVERNSVLLNLQSINLELHNKQLLKDIVYYDFKRFNYTIDLTSIETQYSNYDLEITNKLNNSKNIIIHVGNLINDTIYIVNLNKMINLCNKILNYLILVRNYLLQKNINFDFLINFINYNGLECLYISLINYNLNTTYCINSSSAQNLFKSLSVLPKTVTLDNVIDLISSMEVVINYLKIKITLTITNIDDLKEKIQELNTNSDQNIISILSDTNLIIENYILNMVLYDSLNKSISDLNNPNIKSIIKATYTNYTEVELYILITSLVSMVNIIFHNTEKIDELINTLRLIITDPTIDGIFPDLNNNVTKNNFIYNTTYYNDVLQIRNFKFSKFTVDLAQLITNFADPVNSSAESSVLYKKAISENVLTIISQLNDTFDNITQKLIGIYKFLYNIDTGILPKYDIYNLENIGYMYYLVAEFSKLLNNLSKIIIDNGILLFTEFNPIIFYMQNFMYSITEYLYLIQLQITFRQFNNFNQIGNIVYIPEDILKILSIDEVYKIFKNIIEKIFILVQGLDQNLINNILIQEYENKDNIILSNPDIEFGEFKSILKKFQFGNVQIYNLLKNYVLNSFIIVKKQKDFSSIINKLDFQGENIVVLQDFIILYENFENATFNFDSRILKIINYYNNFILSTVDYYYQTSNIDFYKQLINYNYLKYQFINNVIQNV